MSSEKGRSMLPVQAPPVKRPELVQPHLAVDVEHGDPEDLFAVRMALLHGANHNDPAAFDHGAASGCSCGSASHRRSGA